MFWESSSAKSRRFPWINFAFYRCDGGLCKKRAYIMPAGGQATRGTSGPQQEKTAAALPDVGSTGSGREDSNLLSPARRHAGEWLPEVLQARRGKRNRIDRALIRTDTQPENEKPATANAVAGFDLVGARGFEPLRTHGGIRLSGQCVGQNRHAD
ncbi:hypothetical protein [Burkholderia ubonensis]|uniref:hypothetical protein n=1 Tax=Burkholderia ubonensis TaxID=101571 RepID=UPI0012F8E81E|nr:hypothetical protein [Burkholderia ubonensis]